MGVLRFVAAFVCVLCIAAYIAPLFLNNSTCGYCDCHCSSPNEDLILPSDFLNSSHLDCKKNPELKEEMKKGNVELLNEEIILQKIVTNETLQHTKARINLLKRTASDYQRTVEQCIVGVETCEDARARVESELREELKLTTLWEKRARELGWKKEECLCSQKVKAVSNY